MSDALFGRVAEISTSGGINLTNKNYKMTFDVPFDDDLEVNESECTITNLTDNTVSKFKINDEITIEAGYGNDTGIICKGRILDVKSKKDGIDKVTTIRIIDGKDLSAKKIEKKTYAAGTKGSYILRDLATIIGLPIAKFQVPNDVAYQNGYVVEGEIEKEMQIIGNHCGVGVYIHKGSLYIRPIIEGDDLHFILSANTGLIGKPEAFTEEQEVSEEDMKYISQSRMTKKGEKYYIVSTGYKCKCLLCHRMQVASIVTLNSMNASGSFRISEGKHTYSSDFITEITMLEVK